jgi:hypothetical protein
MHVNKRKLAHSAKVTLLRCDTLAGRAAYAVEWLSGSCEILFFSLFEPSGPPTCLQNGVLQELGQLMVLTCVPSRA